MFSYIYKWYVQEKNTHCSSSFPISNSLMLRIYLYLDCPRTWVANQHGDHHHARMILLMMLVVCLNGTILLEQPFGTFFEFYPRWRDFVSILIDIGGRGAVPWQLFRFLCVYFCTCSPWPHGAAPSCHWCPCPAPFRDILPYPELGFNNGGHQHN